MLRGRVQARKPARPDGSHAFHHARSLAARSGRVQISDINRNIARIKPTLRMVHWNEDAFKVGLCDVPPVRRTRP